MTLDEFLYASANVVGRAELVDGRMIVHEPAKARHNMVVLAFVEAIHFYFFRMYPDGQRPGMLFTEFGVHLRSNPDTLRAPDAAYYISKPANFDPDEYRNVAPDLVMEVVSPSNRAGDLRRKIDDWFRGGSREVWVAHPRKRALTRHTASTVTTLQDAEVLEGSPFFPGLELPVARLFV
jgi:Uma2 family endonuclease